MYADGDIFNIYDFLRDLKCHKQVGYSVINFAHIQNDVPLLLSL